MGIWAVRLPCLVSADPGQPAASCRINRRPRSVRNGGRTFSSGRTLLLNTACAASGRFLRWLQAKADSGPLFRTSPRVEDTISHVQMRATERRQPQANGSCFSPAGATYLWLGDQGRLSCTVASTAQERSCGVHPWPVARAPFAVLGRQDSGSASVGDGRWAPVAKIS